MTWSRIRRATDVMVDGVFAPAPAAVLLDQLGSHPAVAAVAGGRYGEVTINGKRVPTIGLTDLEGTTFPAIIEGRAPNRSDEIVLGKSSLRDLRSSIGDTVTIDAGTGPRNMSVVGATTFPRLNHGSFSTLGLGVGAVARTEVFPPYDLQISDAPPESQVEDFAGPDREIFEFVTVRVRRDATADARGQVLALARRIGTAHHQLVRTEQRPIAIDNYAAVRSTPAVLGVLLGAMAAAALAHLMVNVVRRRRRDLALCVALGMQRVQVLRAVVIQALLVASMALLIGLPLGLAAGRATWRGFASDLGVVETLRLPLGAFGLVVLLVEVFAVAVALGPGLVAARARPAMMLRTE